MRDERSRGQEAGWFKFFHIVVDSGVWARLKPSAQSVYVTLGRHTNDKTRVCWPSNELLGRESGIHVRLVPSATEQLVRERLIKKWRKDRKNFYQLYRGEELERLLPEKMDIGTPPQKMEIRTARRRRDKRGRFIAPLAVEQPTPRSVEQPPPSVVETVLPAAVEGKKSSLRRDLEEEKEKKSTAGSASASPGASASPASSASEENDGEWLLHDKLPRRAFYYQQRQCKAFDRPNAELIRWLRTCVRCTESELQSVLVSEYPSWKGPKDVP